MLDCFSAQHVFAVAARRDAHVAVMAGVRGLVGRDGVALVHQVLRRPGELDGKGDTIDNLSIGK